MTSRADAEKLILPEDIAFLAQLVAPDVQPLTVKPAVEKRLVEAGLVTWLHNSLIPTPRGVLFIQGKIEHHIARRLPAAGAPASKDA